jgi:hypothetical protein
MTSEGAGWLAWAEDVLDWWKSLGERLGEDPNFARAGWRDLARLGRPVAPFHRPDFVAALVGLGGIVLGILLTGVALASLGALLVSLLGLALLLTRVFGISIELDAVPA